MIVLGVLLSLGIFVFVFVFGECFLLIAFDGLISWFIAILLGRWLSALDEVVSRIGFVFSFFVLSYI